MIDPEPTAALIFVNPPKKDDVHELSEILSYMDTAPADVRAKVVRRYGGEYVTFGDVQVGDLIIATQGLTMVFNTEAFERALKELND